MPTPVPANTRGSIATDPLRGFRFQVNINHTAPGAGGSMASRLGFVSVSGLNVETETMAYRQGGFNTTTQKMPGQSNYSPITLSRGMMVARPDSILWIKQIFAVIQGGGTGTLANASADFRADIDIYLLAHPYTASTNVPIKARWKVYNAWPASLAYGDLDAGGNAIVMEQMVLQHEGWDVSYAAGPYANQEAPAIAG
jgi:phage tail-like protein